MMRVPTGAGIEDIFISVAEPTRSFVWKCGERERERGEREKVCVCAWVCV
jgi:hypothetical protein